MRRARTLLIGIAVLAALGLSACDEFYFFDFDSSDYRHRFSDDLRADLEGADKVSIEIVNGYIDVETWDIEEVSIDIEWRIKASDRERAEELADEVKLESRRVGSELRIEIDYGDSYHLRRYVACNLEVKLPADVELYLRTTNGRISVAEMSDKVVAASTNGSIELEGCRGDAELSTTNGKVVARSIDGDLEATTTNGSIEIEKAGGDVFASTTNGAIRLEVERDHGFIIRASTTNGRISDSLRSDEFDSDYNRRRTHLEGRYGDGRHKIELRTTNGSISISEG